MKTYDGFITFSSVSEKIQEKVRILADKQGLSIEVYHDSLSFSYEGKDSNGFVVKLLNDIAATLVNADGEFSCEIETDEKDNKFIFYKIEKGFLWAQHARILREGNFKKID